MVYDGRKERPKEKGVMKETSAVMSLVMAFITRPEEQTGE